MIYKSNTDYVLSKLKGLFSNDKLMHVYGLISQSLYDSNLDRVHEKGRAADGTAIGKYSSKPIYVNPMNAPRKFGVKGKNRGGTKFKNGNVRHTRYFGGGYGQYKTTIGFKSSVVNLTNFGRLRSDWQVQKTARGYALGFGSYGSTLSTALTFKYHKQIWGISKRDKQDIANIIHDYINAKSR